MKIALVLPVLQAKNDEVIFAARNLFVELANGLVRKGHDVTVFCTSNIKTEAKHHEFSRDLEEREMASYKDRNKSDEIKKSLSFPRDIIEFELDLASEAFSYAEENDFDLVHIYQGYQSHYLARLSSIPTVFTLHDPVFPPDCLETRVLLANKDQKYFAISNSQKEIYENKLAFEIADVVHHGIDTDLFSFSENAGEHLAFLGRALPEKGIEDALLVSRETSTALKIVTSDNYKETEFYQSKVRPLISGIIEEVPFLKTEEVPAFCSQAKAVLFPIKVPEPFGMVMIEAMACGTPVIAYAEGSVAEVVKDGKTGFIINQFSSDKEWTIKESGVEGLKKAVEKIYQMSDEEYSQLRQNCRAHILGNFSLEEMVNGHIAAYKKIINSKEDA